VWFRSAELRLALCRVWWCEHIVGAVAGGFSSRHKTVVLISFPRLCKLYMGMMIASSGDSCCEWPTHVCCPWRPFYGMLTWV
jgi:hypothetical protein